jgi:hypothetical protein
MGEYSIFAVIEIGRTPLTGPLSIGTSLRTFAGDLLTVAHYRRRECRSDQNSGHSIESLASSRGIPLGSTLCSGLPTPLHPDPAHQHSRCGVLLQPYITVTC